MPRSVSRPRTNFIHGSPATVGSLMSLRPGLNIHQPLAAEPSPPTFSLLTKLTPVQVSGWNRYLTDSFMPFSAASVTAWVQEVPAVMAMNTSGSFEPSVVIGSLIVGADGSMVSVTKSTLSFSAADWERNARKPASYT